MINELQHDATPGNHDYVSFVNVGLYPYKNKLVLEKPLKDILMINKLSSYFTVKISHHFGSVE